MSNEVRRFLAVACAALLLMVASGTPAEAQTRSQDDSAHAPAAVDVMLLRPAGFVGLVVGTGLFVATLPIVLITRPHEVGTPFRELVARPARFVWADPIGGH